MSCLWLPSHRKSSVENNSPPSAVSLSMVSATPGIRSLNRLQGIFQKGAVPKVKQSDGEGAGVPHTVSLCAAGGAGRGPLCLHHLFVWCVAIVVVRSPIPALLSPCRALVTHVL